MRQTSNTAVFCRAPFASMNFMPGRERTVCCHNRVYVLRTYPTDTLDTK